MISVVQGAVTIDKFRQRRLSLTILNPDNEVLNKISGRFLADSCLGAFFFAIKQMDSVFWCSGDSGKRSRQRLVAGGRELGESGGSTNVTVVTNGRIE